MHHVSSLAAYRPFVQSPLAGPRFGVLGFGQKKTKLPDLFKNAHSDQALDELKKPIQGPAKIIIENDMAVQKYDETPMLDIFKAVGKSVQLKRKSHMQQHGILKAFNKIRAPFTHQELPNAADVQKVLREQGVTDPKQKAAIKKNKISEQAMLGALQDLKDNYYIVMHRDNRIQLTTLGWFIFSEIGDMIDPIRFTPLQLKNLHDMLIKPPPKKKPQPAATAQKQEPQPVAGKPPEKK